MRRSLLLFCQLCLSIGILKGQTYIDYHDSSIHFQMKIPNRGHDPITWLDSTYLMLTTDLNLNQIDSSGSKMNVIYFSQISPSETFYNKDFKGKLKVLKEESGVLYGENYWDLIIYLDQVENVETPIYLFLNYKKSFGISFGFLVTKRESFLTGKAQMIEMVKSIKFL